MVIWTDHALAQLHKLYEHIAQDSVHYAQWVSEELVLKTKNLDVLPYKNIFLLPQVCAKVSRRF